MPFPLQAPLPWLRLYTLVSRDMGFYVVGPFDDQQTAQAWNMDPTNNPDADPRWQFIWLAPDQVQEAGSAVMWIKVVGPEEASRPAK